MTKSNLRRRTSSTSFPICQTERCFGPSRKPTRSTDKTSSATPASSTTDEAAPPTATVTRARGNFCLIAASAGRLKTTSPNWPKSMTSMFRGLKLIARINETENASVSLRTKNVLLVLVRLFLNVFDRHLQTRMTPAARGDDVAHGVGGR